MLITDSAVRQNQFASQAGSTNSETAESADGETAVELISSSPDLSAVWEIICRVAPTDATVLIHGENGTGKDLVARAIHELSPRKHAPLITLNLAAVPNELAEAALFGHIVGSFTGATRTARGFCLAADQGTLFLDEIGEASGNLQAKLLRLLQNGEIQPVGSEQIVRINVRFVTATNRDPEIAVRQGLLREDLFHRLNVIPIRIPPLRERPGDLRQLTARFLSEFNFKYKRHCEFLESARAAWDAYSWPGNVRQMRAIMQRLVILSPHETIGFLDLPAEIQKEAHSVPPAVQPIMQVKELNRLTLQHAQNVLDQEGGSVASAARRLGVSKATLYRWLKRLKQIS